MLETALGPNSLPVDALDPKVARASAVRILVLQDKQHELLLQS